LSGGFRKILLNYFRRNAIKIKIGFELY
jgi:hypothetical protein